MSNFSFDDRQVQFQNGQTVGAALVQAGILSWRTTRKQSRPRGLFCGIGICFDCLITVEGSPNQRACLVQAHQGMSVRTQDGTGFNG